MKPFWRKTSSRPGSPDGVRPVTRAFEAKVLASRLALAWERLWPALWPALGFAGLFLALSFFGIWSLLPLWLHALGVLGLALGLIASLVVTLPRIEWPDRASALRRLERTNALQHRPLTAVEDVLATPPADSIAAALWNAHRERMARMIGALKVALPRSFMELRDPHALRALTAIAVIAGAIAAGGRIPDRLIAALDFSSRAPTVVARVDAWITPPAYTGKAPVFLSGTPEDVIVDVPERSELVIRVSDARGTPDVTLAAATGGDGETLDVADLGGGLMEAKGALRETGVLRVTDRSRELAAWPVNVTPDRPPAIAFIEPPSATERLSLSLHYKAGDDYGLVKVEARIELDKAAIEAANIALPVEMAEPGANALVIPLAGAGGAPGERELRATKDLTAHEWAGLPVVIVLAATDAAGQTAETAPEKIVLPERKFTDPLARALIEQRKSLILSEANAPRVAKTLDALTLAPDRFFNDSGLYLGMRTAMRRAAALQSKDEVKPLADLIYELALRAQDGGLSLAENRLNEMLEQLQQALDDGATDTEIAQMLEELKKAMEEMIQQLAQSGANMTLPSDPNVTAITPQDLADILRAIQELSESGARDAAREMLSQLQNLMQNLQTGQAPQLSPEEQAMGETLEKLGELIEKQRRLMDRSFQEQQRREDPRGGDKPEKGAGDRLAGEQEALRKELEGAMGQLGEGGAEVPNQLGRAEGNMGGARDQLDKDEFPSAIGRQRQALEDLQSGAKSLAQELLKSLNGRGVAGAPGVGSGRGQNGRDPLGRETGSRGSPFGDTVKIPEEREMQRARDILNELRRRAGERGRPLPELEYLERLLRRF